MYRLQDSLLRYWPSTRGDSTPAIAFNGSPYTLYTHPDIGSQAASVVVSNKAR